MTDYGKIAGEAAEQTNSEFAEKISKLTNLTEEQIKAVCPEKVDQQNLEKLIDIVKKSENENVMKNNLINNFSTVGGIVCKLLKYTI